MRSIHSTACQSSELCEERTPYFLWPKISIPLLLWISGAYFYVDDTLIVIGCVSRVYFQSTSKMNNLYSLTRPKQAFLLRMIVIYIKPFLCYLCFLCEATTTLPFLLRFSMSHTHASAPAITALFIQDFKKMFLYKKPSDLRLLWHDFCCILCSLFCVCTEKTT